MKNILLEQGKLFSGNSKPLELPSESGYLVKAELTLPAGFGKKLKPGDRIPEGTIIKWSLPTGMDNGR